MKSLKIFNGRRKTAGARVRLAPGTGKIIVNGKDYAAYFKRKSVAADLMQPLEASNYAGKVDIWVNVSGGGLSGQAGAVKFAISRALNGEYPESRAILKSRGFLRRDSRIVQRKMYGHKKARKSFQFSKR